jgi:hypothetical protein
MNEFEHLRQMRSLRTPVAPQRDLWAAIDARLDAPLTQRKTHPWRQRLLMAAALFGVALFSGVLGLHMADRTSPATRISAAGWKASDPRLAGAAVELNAAQQELNQAMHDAPDSPALRRLLQRTERQQDRLRHLESQAG